jgi:transposase
MRADLGIEFILVSNAGASPDGLPLGSSLVSTLAASQVSESKSSLAANLELGASQLAACNCVSESSESKSSLAAYLERGASQLAARKKCDSESKSSLAAHLEHGASQLAARKFRSLGVSES